MCRKGEEKIDVASIQAQALISSAANCLISEIPRVFYYE